MRRDEALHILREHWPEIRALGVTYLALFGSVARDEATPESDVDLLVDFDPEAHIGLFKYFDIQSYLESILGRRVDLVIRGSIKPRIEPHIMKDLIDAAA
jgi:predicted nucleotidyltransferase